MNSCSGMYIKSRKNLSDAFFPSRYTVVFVVAVFLHNNVKSFVILHQLHALHSDQLKQESLHLRIFGGVHLWL